MFWTSCCETDQRFQYEKLNKKVSFYFHKFILERRNNYQAVLIAVYYYYCNCNWKRSITQSVQRRKIDNIAMFLNTKHLSVYIFSYIFRGLTSMKNIFWRVISNYLISLQNYFWTQKSNNSCEQPSFLLDFYSIHGDNFRIKNEHSKSQKSPSNLDPWKNVIF